MDKGKPEFEPIVKDPKKSDRQYFCVDCGNLANQTAIYKTEDAIIIERYCDSCASKKKSWPKD